MVEPSRGQLQVWHRALNNDLRVTPTGGEDSISNLHISKPVGSVRTYAYLGSEFTASKWLTTLRKGTTFFTIGPLLEFEINGKKPGEAIQLESQGGRVKVNARVWSIVPLSRVVIYRNGQPFRTLSIDNRVWAAGSEVVSKPCAEFKGEIDANESAWYSLYAEGPYSELLDVSMPQAGTNAIRVYVGDQKIRSPESAQYFVRWIDQFEGNGGDNGHRGDLKRSASTFSASWRDTSTGRKPPRSGKAVANAEVYFFALNSINIYARAPDSARPIRLPADGAAVRG